MALEENSVVMVKTHYIFTFNIDDSIILCICSSNILRIDVYGCDGVLLALPETTLGWILEQVLQGLRL